MSGGYRDRTTGRFVKSVAARVERTERTLRAWRERPFQWCCVQMARAHARNMGHRKLPVVPEVASAAEAVRALKAMGYVSIAAMMDAHFERLPAPAFALVGDLLLLPGEDGRADVLGAIGIADGSGNIWAWHDAGTGRLDVIKQAQAAAVAGWRL
ncbi:hypothetical protein V6U71_21445 [Sphingopyxis sp. J-6]|uniref:DUF6950 family protein n=1 Tax=Sphingopyxis sp. J-6 TaxID=3122054 RepID=UPI003983DBCD